MIKRLFQFITDRTGPLEAGLTVVLCIFLYRVVANLISGVAVWDHLAIELAGMVGMGVAFILMLKLLQLVMTSGTGVMGVASTVIKEALSIRIVGMIVVILMLLIPWMVFNIASEDKLSYRVQGYLEYSLSLVLILLSLMTVMLGCRTISKEMEDKQLMIVGVKPVSRGKYILGKWVGIMLLNFVILIVSGAAIYLFTGHYLANQRSITAYDTVYVRDGLLAASVSVQPVPAVALGERLEQEIAERLKNSPNDVIELGRLEALEQSMGNVQDAGILKRLGEQRLRSNLKRQLVDQWMSIPAGTRKTYVFQGLSSARELQKNLQIRYKLSSSRTPPSREIVLGMEIAGRQDRFYATLGQEQIIIVPYKLIDDNGDLTFSVININVNNPEYRPPWETLNFSSTSGMELFYPADTFEMNYCRAMIVVIVKLGFLAMMSLAVASFLSFPVALLAALLICITASFSDFFLSAATDIQQMNQQQGGLDTQLQGLAGFIGEMVARIMLGYSQYKPVGSLVDGRLISWSDLFSCLGWIGVLWTGLTAFIGILIFRSRELARVQV